MNSNLLSKVPPMGTATSNNFTIGLTDVITRTMYDVNSSPTLESFRTDIYKSYNDSTIFDRIVNKNNNPYLKRRDVTEVAVNIINNANLRESNTNDKIFADLNNELPIAFATAIAKIIGPSVRNGKKYVIEWDIASVKHDPKEAEQILLTGLDEIAPIANSTLNTMGTWAHDNATSAVELMRVVVQNRKDLAPVLNDLLVQQNIGTSAVRILENLAKAARVAKEAAKPNASKDVVTYGELIGIEKAILNNETWIGKQNCAEDIISILTPEEMKFIVKFYKTKAQGKLSNNEFVNIVRSVKDINLAKCMLVALYANKNYPVHVAIEMAILAYAIGRINRNSKLMNVANNIVRNIDSELVSFITKNIGHKIDLSDIMQADLTRVPVPILTRIWAAIVSDSELDYIGLNVIPKLKGNLRNHVNAFKTASRGIGGYNQGSSHDMVEYLTGATANVGLSGNNRDAYNASPNVEQLAIAMLRLTKC